MLQGACLDLVAVEHVEEPGSQGQHNAHEPRNQHLRGQLLHRFRVTARVAF